MTREKHLSNARASERGYIESAFKHYARGDMGQTRQCLKGARRAKHRVFELTKKA